LERDKIIVSITGASGVIYGIRLLEVLNKLKTFEIHLIVSNVAKDIIAYETNYTLDHVKGLADYYYTNDQLSSPLSSGSFKAKAMVIIPCSMKTLSGIANGYSENLTLRAADVMLKMRRTLILVVRETPYNIIHLENMIKAAKAGAIILPASPAFYHRPKNMMELVDYIVGRVLDLLEVKHSLYTPWSGFNSDY